MKKSSIYCLGTLLVGAALLACKGGGVDPPPARDPHLTLYSVETQAKRHSFPVTLDSGWWFKSIEAGSDLGRYGNAKRVVYPTDDTVRMDWAVVVRKNAAQVDVLIDSNATADTRIIAVHLQSYKGDQIIQIHQNRAVL